MMSNDDNEKKHKIGQLLKPSEPAEDLLVPDIYAENNWQPQLAVEDHASGEGDEAGGFNPYDTAALYKK